MANLAFPHELIYLQYNLLKGHEEGVTEFNIRMSGHAGDVPASNQGFRTQSRLFDISGNNQASSHEEALNILTRAINQLPSGFRG